MEDQTYNWRRGVVGGRGAQPVRGGERVGEDFAFPVLMILVKWNNSVVCKMHSNIKSSVEFG